MATLKPAFEVIKAEAQHGLRSPTITDAISDGCPTVIPPPWGIPLIEDDYGLLERRWISRELAKKAMLRRVDIHQGQELVGQKGSRDCAGILIPYYWPGESRACNYRLRRDHPEWTSGRDGKLKPERKYLGAPRSGNRLYIPPGVTPDQLQDSLIPIALTEGEFKALALFRLSFHECDNKPQFIPVALAGVWNWRGVIAKAQGAHGERIDVRGPIPDLSRIEWKNRKVWIIFDANVLSNDSVNAARVGICRELAGRGAKVFLVSIPESCGLNGIDDLLAAPAWGPAHALELFAKAIVGLRPQVVISTQFRSKPEGMFRVVTKGEQVMETQLCNYQASITTNIALDDGVEVKREFEIESELMGRKFRFTILASQFAGMDWPIEHMGAGAITFPNQREYARTAIQSASLAAKDNRIYTHTGWRNVDGRWVYLHAAGAIAASGTVVDVNVRLAGSLGRYELRLPDSHEVLVAAVRASLRLLELGPPSITFPLRAATYRAVLGDSDFSLHLAGETGAFKSERAALEQQHFGAGMNRLNLPSAWSSTANFIELASFRAKDALLVIDDFAPHGPSTDVSRYHGAADRVFRAAGNRAGRGRLDSNANLRGEKPPRALILSTGEDVPRGHSIRARLLILEVSKGEIPMHLLSECQADAEIGLYAEAMGAYVCWIAARYEEVRSLLRKRVTALRPEAGRTAPHARTPDVIANLQAGLEMNLQFAEECGAINATQRGKLIEQCWNALFKAANLQAKYQGASEPTVQFISLLRAALASGRAHLQSRKGTTPEAAPDACGWRFDQTRWSPQGDCIGWIEGDHIYLEPNASYRTVQMMGRDIGEALPTTVQTLKKRLREKRFLVSVDAKRQTLTIRRNVAGSEKDVLNIRKSTLLPD